MEIQMLAALSQPNDAMKDVVIPLVSAFGGAVAGAIISYVASSRLAKQTSNEVLARDEATRRDNELRAARQVYAKLLTITNAICGFHKQIQEMIQKADAAGNTNILLSEKLSTLAGIERNTPIEFNTEELSIYIAANNPDYANDLILLARHHETNLSHLVAFARIKIALQEDIMAIGITTRDASGMSRTRLPPDHERYNSIMTRRDELEIFAKLMCTQLAEGDETSRRVAQRFNEVTEAYLGKGTLPDFETAD